MIPKNQKREYKNTLRLPKTNFSMKGNLPQKEPEILQFWEKQNIYQKLRQKAKGKEKFILHDGPPYANGDLHAGHALNKILKDIVTRSWQMMGYDSNYVPGWDCHGLPIEWKVEEQYREKGQNKDKVNKNKFRKECRQFAEKWINIQRQQFKRLGVEGDWENPYTTMAFGAEAKIVRELIKFAETNQLYQGSKPVMWSVVEKTALAEAEVEYKDYVSDQIWVKFPVIRTNDKNLQNAAIVIWTTTPWTIPANRAICYKCNGNTYGLYLIQNAPKESWLKNGAKIIVSDALIDAVIDAARLEPQNCQRLQNVTEHNLQNILCAHPLAKWENNKNGYQFNVPLFHGEHVTHDTGTGFVHTAPGHGRDDFEIWNENIKNFKKWNLDPEKDGHIPFTVNADGLFTNDAPGFENIAVITENGEKGPANEKVIDALKNTQNIIARARLKHQYPHSWRSKKPVIFRNTPQWFIRMDMKLQHHGGKTLREIALDQIQNHIKWIPKSGQTRLYHMIEQRPDWVISRQRAWGVPIAVFVHKHNKIVLPSPKAKEKIGEDKINLFKNRLYDAFEKQGADIWFEEKAKEFFLKDIVDDPENWQKIDDILDVWFESGSTHAFVLEERNDLKSPASIYLEGSDQHRGWFHSSLLESCATRAKAPYETVLTHGFVLNEKGLKMSKSQGGNLSPQDVIQKSGADILRLWVAGSDYTDDLRIGPEIIKTHVDAYRKLRNTIRFMLGNLNGGDNQKPVTYEEMPNLEKYILHKLYVLQREVKQNYQNYDYRKIFEILLQFSAGDLSAFYFDVRKDSLYCDPPDAIRRRACQTVLHEILNEICLWIAPILPFTAEDAWITYQQECGENNSRSIHLKIFKNLPEQWYCPKLEKKWHIIKKMRNVVNAALEREREKKNIGSSLEAHPIIFTQDQNILQNLQDIEDSFDTLADICITSQATLENQAPPKHAFTLENIPDIAVISHIAQGEKCERSWKILKEVGTDPEYPTLSLRDARAVRQWDKINAHQ